MILPLFDFYIFVVYSAIKQENVPEIKKPKKEEPSPDEEAIKKQNDIMFKYRDKLKNLSKRELQDLLEHNSQKLPEGIERVR